MRPRGLTEATLVVLAATALTVVFTFPVAFRIDHVGRVNTDDGRWSIWVVSWVAHALTTKPLDVYQANIFYPHPYALAFSEANLGAGALGAPVWVVTGNPYTTHNVVFLLSFILAFVGAYYLARYLTGSRHAAMVAAIMFAFCPYIFARTAHVQLLFTGGLPFCLLAFHRLVDAPSVRRAISLGVLLWATALACAYYGIFAALMIGLGTVIFAISRQLWRSYDYWIGIGLAAFVSIALTVPFFMPYIYVRQQTGFARSVADAQEYAVDFGAWVASAAWAHRWWLSAVGQYNEVLFPGILATTFGLAGAVILFRRMKDVALLYILIGVLAFWAAFGPNAGLYWLFYETIPIFSFLRAPGRFGVLTTLALTVLASFAVAHLVARMRRPVAATIAIAAIACAELATMPLTLFRDAESPSPVYSQLAALPPGPVVELPYWYRRSDYPRHAYYMLNSTTHWKPLVNGYSDHIPADFRATAVALSSFPTRASFKILSNAGTRYVVFHTHMYDSRLRARLLERLNAYSAYLRPIAQEGTVWLYEIVAFPN